jgi:hypothetical protein
MIHVRDDPSPANGFQAESAGLIIASHQQLTGQALLPAPDGDETGHALYHTPAVVLAHDTAADPVFFYANRAAQLIFEMTWAEMVRLPSRLSAEPLAQDERQRLLELVARQGYIDNYSGIRVSGTGRRFLIERATVWNLIGANGQVVGQAAFSTWNPLA